MSVSGGIAACKRWPSWPFPSRDISEQSSGPKWWWREKVCSGQGIMRWGMGQKSGIGCFHGPRGDNTLPLREPQFFHLLNGNNNVMHKRELIR